MSGEQNKVTFGLDEAHVAFFTGTDEAPAWAAPIKLPGAVSLGQAPAGSDNTLYADNMPYYVSFSNNGYTLTYTGVNIPNEIAGPMFGLVQDDNGLIVEYSDALPQEFALLVQTRGDVSDIRIVYYRCKAARPSTDYETVGESVAPKTQAISIAVTPVNIEVGGEKKPAVMGKLFSNEAVGDTFKDFFDAVLLPDVA